MSRDDKVLVIGADSLIGAALLDAFKLQGVSVVGTSRRKSGSLFFLDLAQPINLPTLPSAHTVFICAGINGFDACSKESSNSAQVNVAATVAIGNYYLKQGGHVVFLSSTAVFGARKDMPDELDELSPNTVYGSYKCAAEIALLETANNTNGVCTVVRLSKVFTSTSLLLKKWHEQGMEGRTIEAFIDVPISPISLGYVTKSLEKVAECRLSGRVHLAGEKIITYAELANALFGRWMISKEMIKGVSQKSITKSDSFPQCAALAMCQTKKLLGIYPQPLKEFLASMS